MKVTSEIEPPKDQPVIVNLKVEFERHEVKDFIAEWSSSANPITKRLLTALRTIG